MNVFHVRPITRAILHPKVNAETEICHATPQTSADASGSIKTLYIHVECKVRKCVNGIHFSAVLGFDSQYKFVDV
jgi:hypothetical protein